MKKDITNKALLKWQRYSGHEKATIIYCLGLLILFLVFPLIKIEKLNSVSVESYSIFNGFMGKSNIILLLSTLFLIVRNGSHKFKQLLHRTMGLNSNQTILNASILFMILCMLYAIGDTVTLINEEFSYRIDATKWFLVLGIYLILGIGWQLAIARINWKQQLGSESISIKQKHDDSKKERDFQQMEKEFEGLFEGNEHE